MSLQDPDDSRALELLASYFGADGTGRNSGYTGARFDTWDSTGTRYDDRHRFTADDLVAVSFLSVDVPAAAAIQLLDTKADAFSRLLHDVGEDRDLVDERSPWTLDWPGSRLWDQLTDLPGVGPTTASKLFARKRPRLRPIYDSVVADVIASTSIWEPLRALLVAERELHDRLLHLKAEANLPDAVSALRVFDVVAWMEGKDSLRRETSGA